MRGYRPEGVGSLHSSQNENPEGTPEALGGLSGGFPPGGTLHHKSLCSFFASTVDTEKNYPLGLADSWKVERVRSTGSAK